MDLTHRTPDDPALAAVLELMRTSFAYMDGVVNPPSSIHLLTLEMLKTQAVVTEVWTLGPPLSAAMILTPNPQALYIGKLSVTEKMQGQGLSRRMLDHAAARASALNLPALELETRIELTANHAAFAALGFIEVARTAHAGYTSPTAITFRKTL